MSLGFRFVLFLSFSDFQGELHHVYENKVLCFSWGAFKKRRIEVRTKYIAVYRFFFRARLLRGAFKFSFSFSASVNTLY